MKKEELFDVLGDIDNRYIADAHKKNAGESKFAWTKWGALAACFAVLILCIPAVARMSTGMENETSDGGPTVIENYNGVEGLQSNKEEFGDSSESTRTETQDALKAEIAGGTVKESVSAGNPEAAVGEKPADPSGEYNEAVGSGDISKETSAFFGGSYTDAKGKFVIVLTEDTPENRTAICKELGRKEDSTAFVKGTYTLAYLTELQSKISAGMANREFPFVVSSSVHETTNNIIIRVTTDDEAELAKVLELDTIGGAIQVELGTCGLKELQSK